MNLSMKIIIYLFVLLGCLAPSVGVSEPTFADLAVFCAKGTFKKYVSADAPVERCVVFLNKKGICFSLFDLVDTEVAVTQEDFARVIGQSMLLFLGEEEIVSGCIKKPLEATTWVDYCLLNDVDYKTLWEGFVQRVENGAFPEVKVFFDGGV